MAGIGLGRNPDAPVTALLKYGKDDLVSRQTNDSRFQLEADLLPRFENIAHSTVTMR